MSRWLFIGAAIVGLLRIGLLAGSPIIHDAGTADCSALQDDPGEPAHGSHESDMYAEADESYADCPIDDATGMGGTVSDTQP